MNLFKPKKSRLRKKLDRALLKPQKNRIVSHKEIKTVGILTSEKISSIIDLKSRIEPILGITNSKMYVFKSFDKSKEVSDSSFTEKDVNWNGSFIQPNLKKFLDEPFDLLIGYFNEKNLYLEMAVSQSKATFKVGFSGVNTLLYELEVLEKIGNTRPFSKEVKKYLQILQKLKN